MTALTVSAQLGLEPRSSQYSTTSTFSGGSFTNDVRPQIREVGGLVPKHRVSPYFSGFSVRLYLLSGPPSLPVFIL